MVYLDNNATTAIAPEAFDVMRPFLTDQFFNPSSAYSAAEGPAKAIERARQLVAGFLGGIADDQVIFTGSATESNNTAVMGAIRANPDRRHLITSVVEHPSVLEVMDEAERSGCRVDRIPVDSQGQIDMDAFVRAIQPDTLLVSIMHANNETGVVFPVAKLAEITKATNASIIFHTDATQTAGKFSLDLEHELKHIDMLSFSGHKLHGPKGVGALFVRRGTRWRAFMCGGHQERGRRAGTENVGHIVALGKACELAQAAMPAEHEIQALRDRLEKGIREQIPWIQVNGAEADRLPNTLNLACYSIEGESILYQLDAAGICASSGSACTSGSLEPSHVLRAMKVPFMAMHGSVRFSLSRYTQSSDIDYVLEVFPAIVDRLRKISPYWDQDRQAPRSTSNAPEMR